MVNKKAISIKGMVYCALFAGLTAVGAYIIVPLPLVPITLQTTFVLLSGTLLGGILAAVSQLVYLLMGLIGFPVFSGGRGGLGVLLGPTGGYLLGFILAALIVGLMAPKKQASKWSLLVALILGDTVIFACGLLQLMFIAQLSFYKALMVGVLPFLPGEALKIALAFIATRLLRSRINL